MYFKYRVKQIGNNTKKETERKRRAKQVTVVVCKGMTVCTEYLHKYFLEKLFCILLYISLSSLPER